jgi:hypothetical protein
MDSLILPILEGTRHVIGVTLSAREVLRISQALAEHEEDDEETFEKYGYSTMYGEFDKLWRRLHQEGSIDAEYEREKSLPPDQCEPW